MFRIVFLRFMYFHIVNLCIWVIFSSKVHSSRDTIQYFNNSFRNAIYDTISENVTITCHVIGNALNDCLGCKDECSNEIDDCPGDLNQCKTCDECKSNFRWYHNGGQYTSFFCQLELYYVVMFNNLCSTWCSTWCSNVIFRAIILRALVASQSQKNQFIFNASRYIESSRDL